MLFGDLTVKVRPCLTLYSRSFCQLRQQIEQIKQIMQSDISMNTSRAVILCQIRSCMNCQIVLHVLKRIANYLIDCSVF
jgi:hypothetical protein